MRGPNRATFRLMLMVVIGVQAAMTLPRLWAARHSTHDGALGVIGDAVNATV
jgi:hypothetical protein